MLVKGAVAAPRMDPNCRHMPRGVQWGLSSTYVQTPWPILFHVWQLAENVVLSSRITVLLRSTCPAGAYPCQGELEH